MSISIWVRLSPEFHVFTYEPNILASYHWQPIPLPRDLISGMAV